jgi:hypothetical protein
MAKCEHKWTTDVAERCQYAYCVYCNEPLTLQHASKLLNAQAARIAELEKALASNMDCLLELHKALTQAGVPHGGALERVEALKADARLGRLVRMIPEKSLLNHGVGYWYWIGWAAGAEEVAGDTPEEALAHLLPEEGE